MTNSVMCGWVECDKLVGGWSVMYVWVDGL